MKIRVNYDLMDKIKESKTGFSLQRTSKKSILIISLAMALNLPSILSSTNLKLSFFLSLSVVSSLRCLFMFLEHNQFKEIYANLSVNQLKQLASTLRSHYINTDYELLQQSYKYETNYRFILDDDKIPRIKEEKYIMVPVVDRDGKKEVSLVQEHLIGSKDYELSYGSPSKSKVLKPVFNC